MVERVCSIQSKTWGAMAKSDPGQLRQQARQLLGEAGGTHDRSKKQRLASQAFALAQEAEATERSDEDPLRAGGK